MSQIRIIKAARGRVTGHFGATNVPGANVRVHKGTDLGHGSETAKDLEVFAPADGVVIAVGRLGTYGNRIEIDHGGPWTSLLAHLADPGAFKAVGNRVSTGDVIARMGSTGGDWPVHLHQELRYNGVPVDAENYFTTPAELGTTPPKRKKPSMNVLYAAAIGQPEVYRINMLTGTRFHVAGEKLGVLKAYLQNGGVLAQLSQTELDSIPKEEGSR